MDKKQILHKHQYGFFKEKSTTYAIFHLINLIIRDLDIVDFSLSTFMDLTRSFDLDNHDSLLKLLQYNGIRGILYNL